MKQYPKISIITPSFNQGKFLEQNILSIIQQNYPNIEHIIIDGGSTDNSVEIIKKYEKHIHYWISEKDKGQSHAINKGLEKATGSIINWLNSDDYLEPNALHTIAKYFTENNIDILCGRGKVVDENNNLLYFSRGTDIYFDNIEKTIGWARIDQPETWWKYNAFKSVMPINEDLHYIMDKDIWIKYLLNNGLNKIKKIENTLINFRKHKHSKTVSLAENFEKETDALFLSFSAENSSLPNNTINVKTVYSYYFFKKFLECYAQNNHKKALDIKKRINLNLLTNEDKMHYKKVIYRIYFIPLFVKKFFKKWSC